MLTLLTQLPLNLTDWNSNPVKQQHTSRDDITQLERVRRPHRVSRTRAQTYPCPDGAMKYRQQWTRLSGMDLRFTLDSAFRKSSHLLSM